MSFWGNLLKIVAIGAFFIATGPFGLSVGSTLATALRIGGVVAGYLGALIDRPRLLTERQQLTLSTALEPGTPLPVVYGRGKLGAIVSDWFIVPDTSKILYYVAAFCHGSRDGLGVAAVDSLWFDQRKAVDLVAVGVTSSTAAVPTVVTTATEHQFTDGDSVTITGHSLAGMNATHRDIVVVSPTTFNIPGQLGGGTGGSITQRWIHPYRPPTVGFALLLGSTVQNVGATAFFGHDAPGNVTDSGWNLTTDKGAGVCVVDLALLNVQVTDTDGDVGPLFRGPPSVVAIIQGNRIYDPRTDMWTPGGDNPALCIRDYLLSTIYGCGFAPTLIHEASFETAADYCDVLVNHPVGTVRTITSSNAGTDRVTTSADHGFATGDRVRIAGHSGAMPALNGDHAAITVTTSTSFTIDGVDITVGGTGGTVVKLVQVKRFTCNGVLDTSRPTADNIQELLSSCRGNLVWEQGQFKLSIRSDAAPAATLALSPSNIIGQWSFRNAGQEEKWNTVKASYIEPANGEFKAQEVQWPPAGMTNAYLTADNEFQNTLDLSLPFTNDQLIAQSIAQVTLNEARHGISCTVHCTEAALAASVGDQVTVTHPTPGWTDKIFWVTAMQLFPDTTVALSLMEYDATAYAIDTMEDRRSFPVTDLDSIFDVPPPGALTLTELSPQGMRIVWGSANYGHVDYYDVQARCASCGDEYATIASPREGTILEAVAAAARAGQNWNARVRTINTAGWPSEWVEASLALTQPDTVGLGVVTYTGFAPTVVISPTPPDLTAVGRTVIWGGNFCAAEDDWVHQISWTVTGPNDTYFRTDIDEANDATGTAYTAMVTDLTTSTSTYDRFTGIAGNAGGVENPVSYYRKFKVKIVRRSDLAVVDSMETTQGILTLYAEGCG